MNTNRYTVYLYTDEFRVYNRVGNKQHAIKFLANMSATEIKNLKLKDIPNGIIEKEGDLCQFIAFPGNPWFGKNTTYVLNHFDELNDYLAQFGTAMES